MLLMCIATGVLGFFLGREFYESTIVKTPPIPYFVPNTLCKDEISKEVAREVVRLEQLSIRSCEFEKKMSELPAYGFKKVGSYASGITFEVPINWSVFKEGNPGPLLEETDRVGRVRSAFLSVGEEDVSYSDTNWTQVDFYFSNGNFKEDIDYALSYGAVLTKEQVGGRFADVITWPLDDGEVTKGGTGGKEYYIPVEDPSGYYKAIVISKQSLGSPAFEEAFKHLIETLEIPR